MEIFEEIHSIGNIKETAVALGFFDGVHLGHRALLARCAEEARAAGLASAVFTFREHPQNVMSGRRLVKRLLPPQDKLAVFESLGIDYVFNLAFEEGFHTMPPARFAKTLLCGVFRAKIVICGFNFHFGKNASGDSAALQGLGGKDGFAVRIIDPVILRGETISSSLIRRRIAEGRITDANAMLGRPYALKGVVAEGNRLGRELGFPTANFALDPVMAQPAFGVYTADTVVGGRALPSVVNIGVKPTVGGHKKLVETHILDFHEDIYGKDIRVDFLRMQRTEQKFANLKALAACIAKDKSDAELFFRTENN
jgi:riboflavin kinase/FMN adenylyltransferase